MRRLKPATGLALALLLSLPLLHAGPATADRSTDGVHASATPRAAGSTLTMTPQSGYLPGANLTLRGRLPVKGRHRIIVERHLNRPGDRWVPMDQGRSRTRANGSFVVNVPASWSTMTYRVTAPGKRVSTRGVPVNAALPETLVHIDNGDHVHPGAPVSFTVDTTIRSGDHPAPPVIAGRALSLQQRVDAFTWTTVATSAIDAHGAGHFTVPAPATPGTWAYRVRQEAWTSGRDRISAYVSHPVFVSVLEEGAESGYPTNPNPIQATPAPATRNALRSAGAIFQWRQPRSDWDWEFGEALESPPSRGPRRRGTWLDHSDGTGRVTIRNAAALIASANEHVRGARSIGTTGITLQGNAQRTGRWEARVLPTAVVHGSSPMRVLVELVPEAAATESCSTSSIVLADYTARSSRIAFGARAGHQQWSRSFRTGPNNAVSRTFAVETTRRHITWFIDGRPVGTLTQRAALPRGPMTMRVSLVGDHSGTNDRAKVGVDWVRTWSLAHGKKVKRKRAFRVTPNPAC
jgi:hypothetical protein